MNTDLTSANHDTDPQLSDAALAALSAGMSKCGPSEIIEPSVPEFPTLPRVESQPK